jgi:hypothetical protein
VIMAGVVDAVSCRILQIFLWSVTEDWIWDFEILLFLRNLVLEKVENALFPAKNEKITIFRV